MFSVRPWDGYSELETYTREARVNWKTYGRYCLLPIDSSLRQCESTPYSGKGTMILYSGGLGHFARHRYEQARHSGQQRIVRCLECRMPCRSGLWVGALTLTPFLSNHFELRKVFAQPDDITQKKLIPNLRVLYTQLDLINHSLRTRCVFRICP